jgi:CheY-like chemotaxis protein
MQLKKWKIFKMSDETVDEKTILVVDDAEANVDILLAILKYYDVIPSTSGEDALALVKEEKVDLILLDILMPGMDGLEVCRRLKADPATMDIPVIFITVKNDEKSIEEAYESGGVDYVTKPFKPVELLARVRTQLTLRETITDLQVALDNIKTLNGLLPICSYCKKIRDDKGYWNNLESYIQKHSDASFTHGICAECADKFYSEELDSI